MLGIHNPLKSKKKRRAKNLTENQAKLAAATAVGDLKKIQKYSGKVANSQAAAESKLTKYRSAVDSAEKFFGHGSPQHRAACAKLVRKAAKYGISETMPDFPTPATEVVGAVGDLVEAVAEVAKDLKAGLKQAKAGAKS